MYYFFLIKEQLILNNEHKSVVCLVKQNKTDFVVFLRKF